MVSNCHHDRLEAKERHQVVTFEVNGENAYGCCNRKRAFTAWCAFRRSTPTRAAYVVRLGVRLPQWTTIKIEIKLDDSASILPLFGAGGQHVT